MWRNSIFIRISEVGARATLPSITVRLQLGMVSMLSRVTRIRYEVKVRERFRINVGLVDKGELRYRPCLWPHELFDSFLTCIL